MSQERFRFEQSQSLKTTNALHDWIQHLTAGNSMATEPDYTPEDLATKIALGFLGWDIQASFGGSAVSKVWAIQKGLFVQTLVPQSVQEQEKIQEYPIVNALQQDLAQSWAETTFHLRKMRVNTAFQLIREVNNRIPGTLLGVFFSLPEKYSHPDGAALEAFYKTNPTSGLNIPRIERSFGTKWNI